MKRVGKILGNKKTHPAGKQGRSFSSAKNMKKSPVSSAPKIAKRKDDVKLGPKPEEFREEVRQRQNKPAPKKAWKNIIPQNWFEKNMKKLTPVQMIIFQELCYFKRKNGRCNPGEKNLAAKLNLGLRTIIRNVDQLEEKRAVKIKRKKGCSHYYNFKNPFVLNP